ncbi:MAG: hypothetical protein ACJA2C_002072 [Marinoscillum sp.]|jgi:uncharacterized protein YrrD
MKRNIESLIGFTLSATDGEIGKVIEFYFDDETWTIRYLIVDTGNWLSGRVVLISPEALLEPDWENKTFPINLTQEQIKHSPDIDTDQPVSRQEEIKLHAYYPWIAYWGSGFYGNGALSSGTDPLAVGIPIDDFQEVLTKREEDADHHLRSTDKVTNYKISATDGEIGNVEDFLMDDANWKIYFMLVDVGHWFSEKKVLLSPDLITEINWETGSVTVRSTVAHVKNSPEYDPAQETTEVYALALHNHYNLRI